MTTLPYIHYSGGFKYQLTRDYSVRLPITGLEFEAEYFALYLDGTLVIKKGYAWDGPSGPTFDTKSFMRGSLVHDALYQAMRRELLPRSYRKAADTILQQICREDGMSKVRAWFVYKAVRRFGEDCARPDHKKKELTAP